MSATTPTGQPALILWRVSLLGRVGSIVTWLLVGPAVGALMAEPFAPAATLAAVIWSGLVALVAYRFAWQTSIRLGEGVVEVRNPFRSTSVRVGDIASVRPGYSGIEIQLKDGSSVTAWAVQKANLSTMFGRRTRADAVVAAILAEAERQDP